jgi:hypothetical protein
MSLNGTEWTERGYGLWRTRHFRLFINCYGSTDLASGREGVVEQQERSKTERGRKARKLKCSFLVLAYSALFYIVFEALNLLLIIFFL